MTQPKRMNVRRYDCCGFIGKKEMCSSISFFGFGCIFRLVIIVMCELDHGMMVMVVCLDEECVKVRAMMKRGKVSMFVTVRKKIRFEVL